MGRLDTLLFRSGTRATYDAARCGLALVLALRLTLGPYARYGGQDDALFVPRGIIELFPAMPSAAAMTAVQVAGAGAAWLAATRRAPRVTFPAAWLALLVLAGLKGSLGKVLHNDTLLLLAAIPFLVPPASGDGDDGRPSRAWGWPVETSVAVIALVYWWIGVQKLRHSGIDWVLGDNFEWVLSDGRAGSPLPSLGEALSRPPPAQLTAGALLALELAFPIALFLPRTRAALAAAAALLHFSTWLVLGLDYWGWALTVVAVFTGALAPGRARRLRSGRSPTPRPASPATRGRARLRRAGA